MPFMSQNLHFGVKKCVSIDYLLISSSKTRNTEIQ